MHGSHGHHHAHDHGDSHTSAAGSGRAYRLGIILNLLVVALQVGAGLIYGSTALLADAAHNLSDVLGLVLAAVAAALMLRPGAARRTYGFAKAGVLAALANGVMLVLASGAIAVGAIGRLLSGEAPPAAGPIIIVAAAGVVINGLTAWLLSGGHGHDLNRRAAMLHMLGDAAVSAGVIVAAGLIWWTGYGWIDPAVALVIVGVVLAGGWGLLRDALDQAMDAAPREVDVGAVRAALADAPGVGAVHDFHVWPLGDGKLALTAHLVRPEGCDDAFLSELAATLRSRFSIDHATVQVERADSHACHDLHA